MTTTDDTRAGLAALTARGHEPRRKLGPEHRTRTLYYDAGMGRIAWRRDGDDMWFHCDDDDAANAVRCALLDRVTEKANALIDRTGGVKLFRRDEPHYLLDDLHPSLLAAYEALYPLNATVGKEPETKGGDVNLVEQYEAMVARGHGGIDGLQTSKSGFHTCGIPLSDAVVAACLQAGQLAAMEKAGISYFYNAGRQYPYQIKMPGTDKWKVYGSWFTAYLTAFPPSAPPDPAAELADPSCDDCVRGRRPLPRACPGGRAKGGRRCVR